MGEVRPRALVLMATFEGAAWLEEQVASIMAQEGVDVTLRIADDQSADGTYELALKLAEEHAAIRVTRNPVRQGVAWNFMQLVYEEGATGYDLYAFSDQDDIWKPDKLRRAAAALESLEDEPALYYSDVVNFDEDGHERRDVSRYEGCEAYPATVLVRNYVNGCAMVWNDALQTLARSFVPDELPRIHDVWMHMVGRFCGTVVADTGYVGVRRRLTGRNAVGEQPTDVHGKDQLCALARLALPPYKRLETRCARVFLHGFEAHLNEDGRRLLPAFATYADTLAGRIGEIRSADFWMPTPQMRLRVVAGLLLGFY